MNIRLLPQTTEKLSEVLEYRIDNADKKLGFLGFVAGSDDLKPKVEYYTCQVHLISGINSSAIDLYNQKCIDGLAVFWAEVYQVSDEEEWEISSAKIHAAELIKEQWGMQEHHLLFELLWLIAIERAKQFVRTLWKMLNWFTAKSSLRPQRRTSQLLLENF